MQQKLILTMAAKCTCKSTCMQVNLVLYTIPTFLWSQFAHLELTFVVKLKTCLARTSAIYSTLRSNFPSFLEDLKIKKGKEGHMYVNIHIANKSERWPQNQKF